MINERELFYKLNAIIEFLKNHEGHKYKVYNHCCPDNQTGPDSDIVEYATDIKCMMENYFKPSVLEDYLINEICTMIRDNIKIFMFDDTKLIGFKEYNRNCNNDKPITISSNLLSKLTKEVAMEVLNTTTLYDFRDLD